MSMNKDSFNYIKSTFPTKQHIIDYIAEIEKLKSDATLNDLITGLPSYDYLIRLFSKEGPEVQASANTQTYGNQKLPSAKKIFIPDKTDPTWMSLRKALITISVQALDTKLNQVSDVNIRNFLKTNFDDKLPDPKSNISLDDPIFDNAWKKYFENIYSLSSIFGPSYYGGQQVIGAFADAVVKRLNAFDVGATQPPKNPTPIDIKNTDTAPRAEQLEALSTFLTNAGSFGSGLNSLDTLILKVAERNFLPDFDKYIDQNRYKISAI